MRILYLSHYFYPEGNAPATRVYEMSRRWVDAGHSVSVVTGVPNVPTGRVYPGYRNRWRQRERLEGIDVERVWTYLAANRGRVLRTINFLSFFATATHAGRNAPRPDVVIATSPQFFCGWAGAWVTRRHRVPFVLEIRDLWPESIAELGALGRRSVAFRTLESLERRLYTAADRVVTVGEGYRDELVGRGVPNRKIEIIPNGVDRDQFRPRGERERLRRELGIGSDFLVSYIGTIGMASGLRVVLRAVRQMRKRGVRGIRFALVGDGALLDELRREAERDGLDEVIFIGRRDKDEIPGFLEMSDACLVHLEKKPLFRTVMPSKLFEATALFKPIILGVEGHAASLVDRAEAGICIEPENEAALVDAALALRDAPSRAAAMGKAGYERIACRFDYNALARRYVDVLGSVARENG